MTIEFDTDQDREEMEDFLNGRRYYCTISDALEHMRQTRKHSVISEETKKHLDEVWEILVEAIPSDRS